MAGVGLTWYTWLEQGKDIQVSAAFLENLARALKLTAAERTHLFALAQHRLPPLSRPAVRPHSSEHLQSILDVIGTPAYVRNSRFDVIAWNKANTRMFGDFSSIPPDERNVIWLMFARSYHRRTMPDWDADARSLLSKFRLSLGQAAEPGEFLALISALNAISADFRQIWAEHEVSDVGEGVTRFCSPREGEILFQHQTLMPEAHPELRIVVFLPSNTGATAA